MTSLNNKTTGAAFKRPAMHFVNLSTNTAVAALPSNSNSLLVTGLIFYGYSAVSATAAPTSNSASAYVGRVDAAGSVVTAGQPAFLDQIIPGSYVQIEIKPGEKFDLKDFRLLGTTNDKVLVVYDTEPGLS